MNRKTYQYSRTSKQGIGYQQNLSHTTTDKYANRYILILESHLLQGRDLINTSIICVSVAIRIFMESYCLKYGPYPQMAPVFDRLL